MKDDSQFGPAYRYFVGQAFLSPFALLALVLCLLAFLPFANMGVPEVVVRAQELMAALNLRAVGPSIFILIWVYCYLRMVTTSYRLEDGYITMGTIRLSGIRVDSMTISMLVDCNLESNWAEALLGLGTLHLRSADHGEPDLYLHGVPDAEAVRRQILERTGLASGRVLGTV